MASLLLRARPSTLRLHAHAAAFSSSTTASSTRSAQPVSLVAAASRGLGLEFTRQLLYKHPESSVVATCRTPDSAQNLKALKEEHPSRLTILQLDVTNESTVQDAAKRISDEFGRLDLLINTAGILHIPNVMQPETSLDKVDPENLLHAYRTNAVGPIIVAKHMVPLLKLGRGEGTGRDAAVIANISARIGSILDNQLGGWYAYRASKAALNQLTRTLGVECLRRKDPIICVSLHPGTVDTDLSRPYSRSVSREKLFSPEMSVGKLIEIIDSLKMEDSAKFFAYDRQEIPW